MDSAYAAWVGQPVVLQVALGDIKVPLRGTLLKDGGETVRMRIGEGWDVDIYKSDDPGGGSKMLWRCFPREEDDDE